MCRAWGGRASHAHTLRSPRQTPGRGFGPEVCLGRPGRSAVQGGHRQRPAGPVAAGGRGEAQGAAGQMPAGRREVTVPNTHLPTERHLGARRRLRGLGRKAGQSRVPAPCARSEESAAQGTGGRRVLRSAAVWPASAPVLASGSDSRFSQWLPEVESCLISGPPFLRNTSM